MSSAEFPNARVSLERRAEIGSLNWTGPAAMLFARSIFAVIAAGVVAVLLALRGSTMPWRDAAIWFPVYATLIDVGCLALLWTLMRREGATLTDLLSFDGTRLWRDIALGFALIPPGLVLIVGGVAAASFLVYG